MKFYIFLIIFVIFFPVKGLKIKIKSLFENVKKKSHIQAHLFYQDQFLKISLSNMLELIIVIVAEKNKQN